jgi:hypothetical protein
MGFQRCCLVAVGAILLATTGLVNQGFAFPHPPFPPPPIFIPPPPSVHVRVSAPPPIVFPAPPHLIMVPGSDVYYAPDIEDEILYSRGYYWRPYEGRWYRARSHGGPWHHMDRRRVPRGVYGLPPGYRHDYNGGPRFHHGAVERQYRGGGRPQVSPSGGPRYSPSGGPRYSPSGGPRIEPR